MFSYNNVKDKSELFIAMTGLTREEFEKILPSFQKAWNGYLEQNYKNREDRERAYGGGQKGTTLTCIEDKLLFILYYFKVYPLQEILAFEFDMTQSTANEWVHILSGILQSALKESGYLPERNPEILKSILEKEDKKEFGIDGTERRIQRPKDNEKQKEHYSGKKKTHTVKNNIIGGLNTRKANYLSNTYEGKVHDKKIADQENPTFPEGASLFQDTGFEGYKPKGVIIYQPKKKPKGKELSKEDKEMNSIISKIRIIMEHIISGVKRCRIVKDIFRNTKEKFDDLVMEIACALHNFRTQSRG
jgi:hypothetical protein